MGSTCARSSADDKEVSTRPPTCTVAVFCADDDDLDKEDSVYFNTVNVKDEVQPEANYAVADQVTCASEMREPLLRDRASPFSVPIVRKQLTTHSHGKREGIHETDLDFCFQFVLPGRELRLRERAKLERRPEVVEELDDAADADRKLLNMENAAFIAYLEAKAKQTGDWKNPLSVRDPRKVCQPFVQQLFKQFIVESDMAEKFQCPEISSLTDARKLCLDLLISFLRRKEEPYYSYMFSTLDHEEVLVCIKMDHVFAEIHADVSEYILQLDKDSILHPDKLNIGLAHGYEGENGPAMQPAHAVFRKEIKELFREHEDHHNPDSDAKSFFRKIDSIRLLYDRLTDVLDIEKMKESKLLLDYFPLHSHRPLKKLRDQWARIRWWYRYDQPTEEIRTYFGENIAMYFIFVEFVCRWTRALFLAGILASAVEIYAGGSFSMEEEGILRFLGEKKHLPYLRECFTLFTVMWSMLFSIYLQRKVWRCYSMWGMDCDTTFSEIKSESNPRFAKMAHMVESEVDQHVFELGVTAHERYMGRLFSVISSLLYVAVAFVSVLYMMKLHADLVAEDRQDLLAQAMPYLVIVPIKVFNILSSYVSPFLTDYEHHRDRLDFENSIAKKKFYMQLLNTFSSFYYIAFLMQPWGDVTYESYGGVWEYLTYEMLITFVSYLACGFLDIILPVVNLWMRMRSDRKKLQKLGQLSAKDSKFHEIPFLELQRRMDTYTGEVRNEDHLQILLPLGFVILFGSTLPLGAGLALLIFGFQLRVDALKLTTAMRRPFPTSVVPGQWIWLDFIKVLMWVAVSTNIGLVCFVLPPYRSWPFVSKVVLFFSLGSIAFVISLILTCLIPVVPREVRLAQQRHQHQRRALAAFTKHEKEKRQERALDDLSAMFDQIPRCDIDYGDLPECAIEDEEEHFPISGVKVRPSSHTRDRPNGRRNSGVSFS